jgi:hypothetical protein
MLASFNRHVSQDPNSWHNRPAQWIRSWQVLIWGVWVSSMDVTDSKSGRLRLDESTKTCALGADNRLRAGAG